MKYTFNFPDIGEGLEEGTIAEWYVEPGSKVETGDPLVKMETDKVVTDIPSPRNGTIVERFGEEGEVVEVGNPLVIIQLEGEESSEEQQENFEVEEEGAGVVGTIEVASGNDIMPASNEGVAEATTTKSLPSKALATPVARALARDLGVDINQVTGSGNNGRVMKEDIIAFKNQNQQQPVASTPAQQQPVISNNYAFDETVEELPLTQIRKTIAKNMVYSKQNAAHMTLFDEAEVSELVKLRDKIKHRYSEKGVKISYLHFLLKAIALSLRHHPQLNAEMDLENNKMILKKYYHLGIAVDAPQGLVVPVLKHADKISLFDIALQTNQLAEKARNSQLSMDDMKGGTFTITNFGSIGGRFAVPVINYPQAAILGAGKIFKKPVVKNDEVVAGTVMPLSISVDHRIVDGGEVTRFMNRVIEYMEDPYLLLLES
jgi:pyruvate dehydrogenase E2 component (dihydrolipoamide acetyltransferase)